MNDHRYSNPSTVADLQAQVEQLTLERDALKLALIPLGQLYTEYVTFIAGEDEQERTSFEEYCQRFINYDGLLSECEAAARALEGGER